MAVLNWQLSLFIIILFAVLIPILSSQIRSVKIPTIVGEVIVGLIIGQSFLGLVPTEDVVLEFLYFFGFAFLMFLSGLEIDFEHLIHPEVKDALQKRLEEHEATLEPDEKHRVHEHRRWIFSELDIDRKPYIFGLLVSLAAIGLSFLFTFLMLPITPINGITGWIYTSIMLSTVSVALVYPTLAELKVDREFVGQKILITTIVAEFTSMLLIIILSEILAPDFFLTIFLIPVIFAIFFAIFQAFKVLRSHPKYYLKFTGKTFKRPEVKVTLSIFLLLFFVILSGIIGIEMILGAFLAGVLISLMSPHEKARELHKSLNTMGFGFFIPVFFILVGARMRIGQIFLNPYLLSLGLVFLGIAYAVKIIPNVALYKHFRSFKQSLAAGILESASLTLMIAAAEIGFDKGFFAEPFMEIIVLIAIFTTTLSPLIFSRLIKSKSLKKAMPKRAHTSEPHETHVVPDPD